jgi:hypothetical protein
MHGEQQRYEHLQIGKLHHAQTCGSDAIKTDLVLTDRDREVDSLFSLGLLRDLGTHAVHAWGPNGDVRTCFAQLKRVAKMLGHGGSPRLAIWAGRWMKLSVHNFVELSRCLKTIQNELGKDPYLGDSVPHTQKNPIFHSHVHQQYGLFCACFVINRAIRFREYWKASFVPYREVWISIIAIFVKKTAHWQPRCHIRWFSDFSPEIEDCGLYHCVLLLQCTAVEAQWIASIESYIEY